MTETVLKLKQALLEERKIAKAKFFDVKNQTAISIIEHNQLLDELMEKVQRPKELPKPESRGLSEKEKEGIIYSRMEINQEIREGATRLIPIGVTARGEMPTLNPYLVMQFQTLKEYADKIEKTVNKVLCLYENAQLKINEKAEELKPAIYPRRINLEKILKMDNETKKDLKDYSRRVNGNLKKIKRTLTITKNSINEKAEELKPAIYSLLNDTIPEKKVLNQIITSKLKMNVDYLETMLKTVTQHQGTIRIINKLLKNKKSDDDFIQLYFKDLNKIENDAEECANITVNEIRKSKVNIKINRLEEIMSYLYKQKELTTDVKELLEEKQERYNRLNIKTRDVQNAVKWVNLYYSDLLKIEEYLTEIGF